MSKAGLENAIPGVKAKALEKLEELGALNPVLTSQIGLLSQHSDFEVRLRATLALHQLGTKEAIPYLIDQLKDEKSRVRCGATYERKWAQAKAIRKHGRLRNCLLCFMTVWQCPYACSLFSKSVTKMIKELLFRKKL